MAYVLYDGNKIQPAPLVSIDKNYSRSEDGRIIGSIYNINLSGYIVPQKGSPSSTGVFWTGTGYPPDEVISGDSRLAAILNKQKALMSLFNKDNQGKLLEIQPDDGSQALTCNPDFVNISFTEDIWFGFCRYTISLVANAIAPFSETFDYFIESASENWSIENNDVPENLSVPFTYRVTHNLSAKGKRHYDVTGSVIREAYEEAKLWCQDKLGFSSAIVQASGGVNIPPSFQALNKSRSEAIDINGGSYNITETWIMAEGNATEDFSVSSQSSSQDGLTSVSIEGSIQGLYTTDNDMNVLETKYQSASDYYNTISTSIFTRAQSYGGITLNPIPLSSTLGKNPLAGTITYSFEYNNRPSALISGALYETLTIGVNDRSDKFAAVPVLGRYDGPVLQNLNTSDAKTKTLSVEAVFGPSLNPALLKESLIFPFERFETLLDVVDPINNGATVSFRGQPQETWEPITGRASLQVEWTYE